MFPAASAGPSLLRMTSIGKLDGVMAATTPTASLTTVRRVALTEQSAAVESPFPFELVDQPGRIAQCVGQRPVELGVLRCHGRASDLGDQFLTQFFGFGFDGLLQLEQGTLPQARG